MEREFSRSRFGDRGFDRFEKPVKVGEEYDVEIKETGSKGDGIARVKNFVVFVANTKKGDKIKIKITQVARKFAIGEKVGGSEAAEETEEETTDKETEEIEEKPEEMEESEELEGEEVED